MKGLTEYDTPQGVHVLRVHYTADPEKCSEEWKNEQKKGMTQAAWEQEYEINFHVPKGKAYYPEFRLDFHVAQTPLSPIEGRPIFRGWDFGLTPCTVFAQTTAFGQAMILYPELQSWDSGIQRHGELVRSESQTWFSGYKFIDYGDPAGTQRAQTDEKTCFQVLSGLGITVLPGPVSQTEREEPMRQMLTRLTPDGHPMFLVDPRCTWLIGALTGGYCRRQTSDGRILDDPEKNDYSHIVDALCYIVAKLMAPQTQRLRRSSHRLGAV